MAANDLKLIKGSYGTELFRTKTNVNLGIGGGDGMIIDGTNTHYCNILADGMPTRGTDVFLGVSETDPRALPNTATADGTQSVNLVGMGSVIVGRAKTAANINTDAKLLLILNDTTSFARSAATAAGLLTINETTNITALKSSTQSLVIQSGDIQKGTLRVYVCGGAYMLSNI